MLEAFPFLGVGLFAKDAGATRPYRETALRRSSVWTRASSKSKEVCRGPRAGSHIHLGAKRHHGHANRERFANEMESAGVVSA
jgi:hypothetical protein